METNTNVKQEEQRPRLTKEQIIEHKISLARERGSRVLRIDSPMGNVMFNILRQFDQAYAIFKQRLGEPGGITYEQGAALMEEAQEAALQFSKVTRKLSKKTGWRYSPPQTLKDMRLLQKDPAE